MAQNDIVTAADVLDYIDEFAGQEDSAEQVRDFVQRAAEYIGDGVFGLSDWAADETLGAFAIWLAEKSK